jgi:hypothetical protein
MSRFATAAAMAVLALDAGATAPLSPSQAGASRVLLVEVFGPGNQALVGLESADFAIDEGGEPRDVFAAYPADYPVVILVDDTPPDEEVDAIRSAAEHLIERIGQRPIVVGTLSSPSLLTSFDDDRAALLQKLRALRRSVASAPTMPHDGLTAAVGALRDADAVFASIIVVASRPEEAAAEGGGPALAPVLQSGAIVHAVIRNPRPMPPAAPSPPGRPALIRELADQTGGQYVTIYSMGSYRVALDRIADRLAGETILEYMVPEGSVAGGAVRVGVRIPGARVRGLALSRSRN